MRQPTDRGKIQKLKAIHARLKELFRQGKLKDKIIQRLKQEAQKLGISYYTYRKYCYDKKNPPSI